MGYHILRKEKVLSFHGHQHYKRKEYTQATDYYMQAIDHGERKKLIFQRLEESILHYQNETYVTTMYDTLLSKYPEDVLLLQIASRFYINNNDFDRASKAYKRILALEPYNVVARFWYARILSWSGKHEDAIKEFKILLK